MDTSGPIVPTEVLEQIVGAVDPHADRQTLVNLMTTCSTLWEIAARHLYASPSLNNQQLLLLFRGGRNLSPRSRKALTFVHRLRISPQLQTVTILRLWQAAYGSEGALFPNVRQLLYVDDQSSYSARVDKALRLMVEEQPVPAHAIVFENPDVCLTGPGYTQLLLLPIRAIRSITYHGSNPFHMFSRDLPLPPSWKSFRVFDHDILRDRLFVIGFFLFNMVRYLQWKGPDLQPPIQVCMLADEADAQPLEQLETLPEELETALEADGSQRRGSMLSLKFELYPRQEPHGDCRPCEVCGESLGATLHSNPPQVKRGSPILPPGPGVS